MGKSFEFILWLFLFITTCNVSFSQGQNKAGDIFLNLRGGATMGYLFGEEQHYAYHSDYEARYDGRVRVSFHAGINFMQMISQKLFYSAGIQYKTRKMRLLYDPEYMKTAYPFMFDPMVEEFKTFHDLEYPMMLGINFNRITLQSGINVVVLRHEFIEAKSKSGKMYASFGGTQLVMNFFPAITASYQVSKSHNIYVFTGLEKQFAFPWYFANAGLSVTWGLKQKKGNHYKYCKPPG